jgi:hypothetical protein
MPAQATESFGPEVNDPFDPSSAGFDARMEDPSFRAKLDEHMMSMYPPPSPEPFTPEPVEDPWKRPPPIEMMGSSFSPAPIRKGSGKMFSERPGLAMVRKSMAEEAEAARLLGTGVAGASTSSMKAPGFRTGSYTGGMGGMLPTMGGFG